MRAQALLQEAEAAQAALTSSTFDGSMSITFGDDAITMSFRGATSKAGEWFSLRSTGTPALGDMSMDVVVRGGRAWTNLGGRWQSAPVPAGAAGAGTMNAAAFQQLARHVRDVRVSEHQLVGGKPVTTIGGDIDAQGMLEAFAGLGSIAGESLDLSKLGVHIGDIHAVLTIDERTRLLDSAFITFSMEAEGRSVELELRYRLTSVNEPVRLPSPTG